MKDPWQIFGSLVLVVFASFLGYLMFNHKPVEVQPAKPAPFVAPKLQLVYVTSAKCVWCDKMKRNTIANAKVADRLGKEFVYIEANGKDAVGRYNVTAVPTYILLSPEGKEVRRGTGYRTPEEFLAWLDGRHAGDGVGEQVTPIGD